MKVVKYEKDAVLIQDGNIKAWIDVWIENEDVECDWNQNDFLMTNPKDRALEKWQDNLQNFEDATDLAVETLEKAGIIYKDKDAKWRSRQK